MDALQKLHARQLQEAREDIELLDSRAAKVDQVIGILAGLEFLATWYGRWCRQEAEKLRDALIQALARKAGIVDVNAKGSRQTSAHQGQDAGGPDGVPGRREGAGEVRGVEGSRPGAGDAGKAPGRPAIHEFDPE